MEGEAVPSRNSKNLLIGEQNLPLFGINSVILHNLFQITSAAMSRLCHKSTSFTSLIKYCCNLTKMSAILVSTL